MQVQIMLRHLSLIKMAAIPLPEVPLWCPSLPAVPAGHPVARGADASSPAGSLPSPIAAGS